MSIRDCYECAARAVATSCGRECGSVSTSARTLHELLELELLERHNLVHPRISEDPDTRPYLWDLED